MWLRSQVCVLVTSLTQCGEERCKLRKKGSCLWREFARPSNMPEESQSQNETLKSANFPKIPRAAVFPITSDPHACVGFIEVEGHSS